MAGCVGLCNSGAPARRLAAEYGPGTQAAPVRALARETATRYRQGMSDPTPFAPEEAGGQPAALSPDFVASRTRAPSSAPIKIPQTLTETTGPTGAEVWAQL